MIDDYSAGLESGGQRLDDGARCRINYGNCIGPSIRDVDMATVTRDRDAAGDVSDFEARRNLRGLRVDDSNFVAVLTDHVEQLAVRRKRHLDRRKVALFGKRGRLLLRRLGCNRKHRNREYTD